MRSSQRHHIPLRPEVHRSFLVTMGFRALISRSLLLGLWIGVFASITSGCGAANRVKVNLVDDNPRDPLDFTRIGVQVFVAGGVTASGSAVIELATVFTLPQQVTINLDSSPS